ncbi:hypothetical protein ACUXV3_12425 [Roseobacteraceae bacterium NS-SX3]
MTAIHLHTRHGTVNMNALPAAALSAGALASTLAKVNRFAGRTAEPWSVASHSVLVSRLCRSPDAAAWALLHDAHEAFLGDLITPAVVFIASQSQPMGAQIVLNSVRQAKASLDRQIRRAWDIAWDKALQEVVDRADQIALQAEMFVFFGAEPEGVSSDDLDRAIDLIRGLPQSGNWHAAATLWEAEAERLAYLAACRLPHPTTQTAA